MTDYLPTSAETHPFLVRDWENQFFQAPAVFVRWHEVHRTKRVIGGLFNEVEHDHWDHSKLYIVTAHPRANSTDVDVVAAAGVRSRGGNGATVANSNDGVKKVLRRITPDDATAIENIDNRIIQLQQQLADTRTERKAVVAGAWRRGQPVLVHDLRPSTDDDPPSKYFPERNE